MTHPAQQPTDDSRWKKMHIDPTINLGHIITTVSMLFCLVWWGGSVETRLTTTSARQDQMEKRSTEDNRQKDEQRRELREELRDIKAELKELNNRLIINNARK